MERELLIADADGFLSDLYLKYFAAHGDSVRVASGGVECLTALRETTPDVLVLDTELRWGGADGVLAVKDEEGGLSAIPVVLLNDTDGKAADGTDHQLEDDLYHAFHTAGYAQLRRIGITLQNGRVELQGRVPTYFLKQFAQSLAASLPGVQAVDNHIEVASPR